MPYLEMHRQVIARSSGLRADALIVSCAISAGIHGALAPEHFREATAAGAGFVVATVVLAALAVALAHRPASRVALVAAAGTMLALLVSYGLAVTTGLPVLHPEVEPVDGLALFTKAVEAAGLVAASSLLGRASFALEAHAHIRHMSDLLSGGIVEQFPKRFRPRG